MIRIAHISDLHVLSRTAAQWRRIIFNKRMTGYANLVLHRGRVHRRDYLLAVLSAAAAQADQLVVTGDITNLSLEHEYEEAVALLDEASRRTEVTVVPGNHDIYLTSTYRARRFPHHFGRFNQSDLPELAQDLPVGRYHVSSCATAWRLSRYRVACHNRRSLPPVTSVVRSSRRSRRCSHIPKCNDVHQLC